jgi:uncharacterized membrane protein YdjX (TVP38/TMEM64 family)
MNKKKLLLAAALLALVVAFFAFDLGRFFSLAYLKGAQANFATLYAERPVLVIGLYALVYIAAFALALPAGAVLTLAGGALFGVVVGTVVVSFASTIGATVAFLAARYLFAGFARRRLGLDRPAATDGDPPGLAARLNQGFNDDAFNYLLFLRLVPLFPFWLVNLATAFSEVTVRTYVAATALGILPGVFVFANLGQSLGRIDSTAQLVSPATLGAFALLCLFALVPVLVRRLRRRVPADPAPDTPHF